MSWFSSLTKGFSKFTNALELPTNSSLADLKGKWHQVQKFFIEVQSAADESNIPYFVECLPTVEAYLNSIIALLLSERSQFVVCVDHTGHHFPPCYQFMFNDPNNSSEHPSVLVDGRDNITSLIQHAKHNQPPGARAMVLRFLCRLFNEVDTNVGTKSLLHINNDFVAAPLVDALEKISVDVNPSSRSSDHTRHSKITRNIEAVHKDRAALVALLHSLCVKVEQIPSVASFFVKDDTPLTSSTSRAEATTRLLLLDITLPYLKDHVELLEPDTRHRALRCALHGIIALAKTPDPIVRGFVSAREQVATMVVKELCHALITACKVPEKAAAEFSILVSHVTEYVKFIELIILVAPECSVSWKVPELMTQFLQQTLRQFLESHDERVYCSAAIILSGLLQQSAFATQTSLRALSNMLFYSSQGQESVFCSALLPRLSDTSDEVVATTLQLIESMFVFLPHSSLRHVFGVTHPFVFPSGVCATKQYAACGVVGLVPVVNATTLFPAVLRSERGLCGSSAETFLSDIWHKFLFIETNLSEEELKFHQPTPSPATPTDNSETSSDIFWLPSVCEAPLTSVLCSLTSSFLRNSLQVNLLLTGLLSTTCMMPDSRVLYSLLHPQLGPLTKTLRALVSEVDAAVGGAEDEGAVTPRSKLGVFRRYADRPFFDTLGEDDVHIEELSVLQKHRNTIEGFVCLEGLDHELSHVIALTEMSLKMVGIRGETRQRASIA